MVVRHESIVQTIEYILRINYQCADGILGVMKTRTLKQLVLYNYRYLFAYFVIALFAVYFLGWQLTNIGPGLSQPELITAARHLDLRKILELPLYPLQAVTQWLSFEQLGISTLSMRLPSVLMGGITAISLYYLLKRWFGKATALLSVAILISADWFLFISRLGVGSIEFSFWLALSLFSLTKLIERKQIWLIGFSLALIGLLFCPFGPYVVLTLIACIMRFSTFRQRINSSSLLIKSISGSMLTAGLVTFALSCYGNTEFLKNIMGIQNLPSFSQYLQNLLANSLSIAVVLPGDSAQLQPTGLFFVRFFEAIFVTFGVIMLWRTRVNRLNVVILILSVVLVLTSGLSSGSRGSSLLLVPAAIYMTAGIRHFFHRWQRTFPKNPYARVAAFVPTTLVFGCVVLLHYQSYFALWPRQVSTNQVFTQDFTLLKAELNKPAYNGKDCLVITSNQALQVVVAASKTTCRPQFATESTNTSTLTTIRPLTNTAGFTGTVKPLVSPTRQDNIRWLVFNPKN